MVHYETQKLTFF